MKQRIISIGLSACLASTSMAQTASQGRSVASDSSNICAQMVRNEREQIQVLTKLKKEMNNLDAAKRAGGAFVVADSSVSLLQSVLRIAQNPTKTEFVIGLFEALSIWVGLKTMDNAAKSKEKRSLTLDDMISQHEEIAKKAGAETQCSVEVYQASLVNLLAERVALHKAGIEVIKPVLAALEKETSPLVAPVVTIVGAAGLLYLTVKNGSVNWFTLLFGGGASLLAFGSGANKLYIDHIKLKPMINQIRGFIEVSEAELGRDMELLSKLSSQKLN